MKYGRRSGNSYKKAIYKDSGNTKWAKRQASKAVRRYKGPIPDGAGYKKIYNSWDICDWKHDCCHGYNEEWVEWHYDWHLVHDGDSYVSK